MTVTSPTELKYTADFDIGGTFTDGFFTDGRAAHRAKVFTTPHDLTEGFLGCLRLGADAFEVSLREFLTNTQVVRLSTTLGTNTLLQKRGPKVGLIVSRGAEDDLYGPPGTPAAIGSIIEPELVRGIDERVEESGRCLREPSSAEVLLAVRHLLDEGARIIAVSLANSWRNPINERRVREIVVERYPVHYLRSVPLQLAHEITSSDGDHARVNTVLMNAYLHRDLSRGLYRAEDLARQEGMSHPLLIVHAAGGSARVAKTVAVQTLSSGPAVAVRGASIMARQLQLDDVVCADMGGTSLDVAVLGNGEPPVVDLPKIEGIGIAIPMISTESIGAGGGSIARVQGGELRVGPESAGSVPGPVCYGKGGMNATVTDANLLLGMLDPEDFLGGRMRLDLAKARDIVERRIAQPLGVDLETAAAMIRSEVNISMAKEIRERIEASKADPSKFTFFAFGGGGPLHACDIAENVGIKRVVGFPFGSVFSAFGSSTVDVWHRYSRSMTQRLDHPQAESSLVSIANALVEQGRLDMRGEGFPRSELVESFKLSLGNSGDMKEIDFKEVAEVPVVLEKVRNTMPGTELRGLVLDVRAKIPTWLPQKMDAEVAEVRPRSSRMVRWSVETEAVVTPVVKLEEMRIGSEIDGPALIETKDTVYAVKHGWMGRIDNYGNIVMELIGGTV